MANTLLVTIESRGRIPLIAADGPIMVPTPLSKSLVAKLVMSGVVVNECNPNDIHQTVRITRSNLNENRFPPVVPTPEQHPTGKEIPTVNLVAPDPTPVVENDHEADETTEEGDSEEKTEEKPVQHTQAQAPVFDKYAGLSKNQRKRLRQQEAAAAAAAAKEAKTEETSSKQ